MSDARASKSHGMHMHSINARELQDVSTPLVTNTETATAGTNTKTVSRFQVQASVDVEDHNPVDNTPPVQQNGSSPTEHRSSKVDFALPIKLLKTPKELKLKFTVMVLFVLILVGTIFILLYYQEEPYHYDLGGLTVYVTTSSLSLVIKQNGMKKLLGSMGEYTPGILPATCTPTSDVNLCVEWKDYGKLRVVLEAIDSNIECYHVRWETLSANSPIKDCFNMSNTHWYGGSTMMNQAWPISDISMNEVPFITSHRPNDFGSVVEQYWVTSHGVSVKVDKETPLTVTILGQDQKLCLDSHYLNELYLNRNRTNRSLNYTICVGPDVKAVYNATRILRQPDKVPAMSYLENPIWSIDTDSQGELDSSSLLNIAKNLQSKGLQVGLLDIKAKYSNFDGDFVFDEKRFNMSFVQEIQDIGLMLSVSVVPFASTESQTFYKELQEDYFVLDPRGNVPGLTEWDRGIGAIIDVTDKTNYNKLLSTLRSFMDLYNLDFLTFDYGEASFLPYGFQTARILENPSAYTTQFNELAHEVVDTVLTRSAYHNQDLPIVIRTYPKGENWNQENGIKSVIPTILTLSLLGYPFMALDVQVFANYDQSSQEMDTMDKELLIRYIEISAFLPVMQIPISVLNYDNELMTLVQKWVQFHYSTVALKIREATTDFMADGTPVIRPMWWLSDSTEALNCGSQFLIGDSMIVAPVLDRGHTHRMVYLPRGTWQFTNTGTTYEGPNWFNVTAQLSDVPYFIRATS